MLSLQCLPCVPGHISTNSDSNGEVACDACVAGQHQEAIASSSCKNCGIGKYSKAGSAECSFCAAGQAQPLEGGATCNNCVEGKYRTSNDTGYDVCKDCPIGYHQDTRGQANCIEVRQ